MTARRPDLIRLGLDGTPLALLAVVFFVVLFLPWAPTCLNFPRLMPYAGSVKQALGPIVTYCGGVEDGLGGAGFAAAAFALGLFAWEGMRVARLALGLSTAYRSLISTFLSGGVLVFTILDLIPRFGVLVSEPGNIPFDGAWAWVGLLLALLIAVMGVVHWQLFRQSVPAPGPTPPAEPPRCPACSHPRLRGALFCSHCGSSLSA